MSSSHFDGSLFVSFAVVAILAAIATVKGRAAFKALGCAGTWLMACYFGFDALLIANLFPDLRVSVDTTSAALVWALALGASAAGVLLVLAVSLDSGRPGEER